MDTLMHRPQVQMLASLRRSMPNVPEAWRERLAAKLDSGSLLELIVPIYDQHRSLEGLRTVNVFYESPVGQRIRATLPAVMKESLDAGSLWGQRLSQELLAELTAENSALGARPAAP